MKMKRIANNVALQTIGYVISGFTNVYIYVRECGYQKRYCSSCTAENCDACANEQFRNNPEWWLSLPTAEVEQ